MYRKVCSRKIDELGRVVIPMEARYALGIKDKQVFDVYIDDTSIIFKPNNETPACCICGDTISDLKKIGHSLVCLNCVAKIKES